MSAADRIEIAEGYITRLEVGAIVNAANEPLLGGGGVGGLSRKGWKRRRGHPGRMQTRRGS